MEGIRCRKAKITDQPYIDEISRGLYFGTDYTPKIFPKWLADENWQLFVAETALGNVVGFTALHIIDGRTSVVVRSSRVAESHRGKGIYTFMLDYALFSIQLEFNSVRTVIRQRLTEYKVPIGYQSMMKYAFTVVHLDPSTVRCNGKNKSSSENENPNLNMAILKPTGCYSEPVIIREMFSTLCNNKTWVRELFSNKMVIIGPEIYNVDNLESMKLLNMRDDLLIHVSEDGDSKVLSIVDLSYKETVSGNQLFTLDLYGNDVYIIKSHALKALDIISRQVNGAFDLFVNLHSKEAEEMAVFFQQLKNCETVVKGLFLQVLTADIDQHPYKFKPNEMNNNNDVENIK